MANREVNLTKRIETSNGWRYCPVVYSSNAHYATLRTRIGAISDLECGSWPRKQK
jgi:hypothetical protein